MVQPRSPTKAAEVTIGPVRRFGRYILVKKLATGGMAEIWLSRQSGLAGFNRFIVIKKILSHLAEEQTFVDMFRDEARMSAQLTHPNIVQVYDLGESDGTFFIAMEYIAGENLAALAWRGVKRNNPLSPPFAARILADSCKALHYAHHLKGSDGVPLEIVHRDISPQNILVTYEGEVKVVDFGIAKAASKSQHTKTGMLKGKFSYMSPEQCLGHPVDKRSDIFALGIVLYELCTGKRLFKHESELMILEMITKRRITPPREVAPNIAPALEAIILKALEKDVEQRYQTAQEMQIALEDYLRSERRISTNADLSSFMRELFGDKIDEKRRLVELASRDELIEAKLREDQPEGAGGTDANIDPSRRRVVYGRPSDVRVSGVAGHPQFSMPGQPVPGMTANGQVMMPMPGMPMTGAPMVYPPGMVGTAPGGVLAPPGAYVQTSNWGPRVIIAGALLVIFAACGYLYWELNHAPVEAPPPTMPTQTGWVKIESIPDGADILVNGNPVPLDEKNTARTPIEQLTPLDYGRTYKLELRKPGYEPYSQTFTMDANMHGKLINPRLSRIPSELKLVLAGSTPSEVKFLVNGRPVGQGRDVITKVTDERVSISAAADGYDCSATPAELSPPPGGAARSEIRCRKPEPRPAVARRTTRDPGPTPTTRPPPPPKPRRSGGCEPEPGAPPGSVTIDTRPASEVFLGGRSLGTTPLNKQEVPSGCVQLKVVVPSDPSKSQILQIRVQPNKNERYRYDFDARRGGSF